MKILYVEDNDDKAFAEKPALAPHGFPSARTRPGLKKSDLAHGFFGR
jgi:hypothetical protein